MFTEKRHNLWLGLEKWHNSWFVDGTDNRTGICLSGSPITKTFMTMLDWMVVRWIQQLRIHQRIHQRIHKRIIQRIIQRTNTTVPYTTRLRPRARARTLDPTASCHDRHDRHHRHRRP